MVGNRQIRDIGVMVARDPSKVAVRVRIPHIALIIKYLEKVRIVQIGRTQSTPPMIDIGEVVRAGFLSLAAFTQVRLLLLTQMKQSRIGIVMLATWCQ